MVVLLATVDALAGIDAGIPVENSDWPPMGEFCAVFGVDC
jgi:hypothetical protein